MTSSIACSAIIRPQWIRIGVKHVAHKVAINRHSVPFDDNFGWWFMVWLNGWNLHFSQESCDAHSSIDFFQDDKVVKFRHFPTKRLPIACYIPVKSQDWPFSWSLLDLPPIFCTILDFVWTTSSIIWPAPGKQYCAILLCMKWPLSR